MKIYGYKKDDENLICLEEATVHCTYEESDFIIAITNEKEPPWN